MDDGLGWSVPVVIATFGVLFLAARKLGAAPEALCWGIGFVLSAAAFAFPITDVVIPTKAIAFTSDTLFALSFFSYAWALVLRFTGPRLLRTRIAMLAVGVAAPIYGIFIADSLPAEILASELACAFQLGFALLTTRCWPSTWIDKGLVLISWVIVIQNLLLAATLPLTIASAEPEAFFSTEYSKLLSSLALLTSLAFAVLALFAVMSEVVDRHRRDALVDPLTGLFNRRGLASIAGRALVGQSVGVICCDLDRFKHVNDTWGHEAGDRVLVLFAGLLREVVGSTGVAARTGGEECVVYLAGASGSQARIVAERLQFAMRRLDWSSTGIKGAQTASFGVTERSHAETLEDALRRADRLVYEAKRTGRDRIEDDLGSVPVSLFAVNA